MHKTASRVKRVFNLEKHKHILKVTTYERAICVPEVFSALHYFTFLFAAHNIPNHSKQRRNGRRKDCRQQLQPISGTLARWKVRLPSSVKTPPQSLRCQHADHPSALSFWVMLKYIRYVMASDSISTIKVFRQDGDGISIDVIADFDEEIECICATVSCCLLS